MLSSQPWLLHEWGSEVSCTSAIGWRRVSRGHRASRAGYAGSWRHCYFAVRSVAGPLQPLSRLCVGLVALSLVPGSAERPQLVSWCLLAAVVPVLRRQVQSDRSPWWSCWSSGPGPTCTACGWHAGALWDPHRRQAVRPGHTQMASRAAARGHRWDYARQRHVSPLTAQRSSSHRRMFVHTLSSSLSGPRRRCSIPSTAAPTCYSPSCLWGGHNGNHGLGQPLRSRPCWAQLSSAWRTSPDDPHRCDHCRSGRRSRVAESVG